MFWTLTVTLTRNTATQSFHKMLLLMMMYHQRWFGCSGCQLHFQFSAPSVAAGYKAEPGTTSINCCKVHASCKTPLLAQHRSTSNIASSTPVLAVLETTAWSKLCSAPWSTDTIQTAFSGWPWQFNSLTCPYLHFLLQKQPLHCLVS